MLKNLAQGVIFGIGLWASVVISCYFWPTLGLNTNETFSKWVTFAFVVCVPFGIADILQKKIGDSRWTSKGLVKLVIYSFVAGTTFVLLRYIVPLRGAMHLPTSRQYWAGAVLGLVLFVVMHATLVFGILKDKLQSQD